MADRIQLRRDTKANWESYNPILLEGEPGHVLDDPNLYKMGDGVHAWNDLPYRGYSGTMTQDIQDSPNTVPSNAALLSKFRSVDQQDLIQTAIDCIKTNKPFITDDGRAISLPGGGGIDTLVYNWTGWHLIAFVVHEDSDWFVITGIKAGLMVFNEKGIEIDPSHIAVDQSTPWWHSGFDSNIITYNNRYLSISGGHKSTIVFVDAKDEENTDVDWSKVRVYQGKHDTSAFTIKKYLRYQNLSSSRIDNYSSTPFLEIDKTKEHIVVMGARWENLPYDPNPATWYYNDGYIYDENFSCIGILPIKQRVSGIVDTYVAMSDLPNGAKYVTLGMYDLTTLKCGLYGLKPLECTEKIIPDKLIRSKKYYWSKPDVSLLAPVYAHYGTKDMGDINIGCIGLLHLDKTQIVIHGFYQSVSGGRTIACYDANKNFIDVFVAKTGGVISLLDIPYSELPSGTEYLALPTYAGYDVYILHGIDNVEEAIAELVSKERALRPTEVYTSNIGYSEKRDGYVWPTGEVGATAGYDHFLYPVVGGTKYIIKPNSPNIDSVTYPALLTTDSEIVDSYYKNIVQVEDAVQIGMADDVLPFTPKVDGYLIVPVTKGCIPEVMRVVSEIYRENSVEATPYRGKASMETLSALTPATDEARPGYVNENGQLVNTSAFKHLVFSVRAYRQYKLTNPWKNSTPASPWQIATALGDGSSYNIAKAGPLYTNEEMGNKPYYISSNIHGYLIVNMYIGSDESLVKLEEIRTSFTDVGNVRRELDVLEEGDTLSKSTQRLPVNYTSGIGYFYYNGNIGENPYFFFNDYVVEENKFYLFSSHFTDNTGINFLSWLDANHRFIGKDTLTGKGAGEGHTIPNQRIVRAPEGARYARLNCARDYASEIKMWCLPTYLNIRDIDKRSLMNQMNTSELNLMTSTGGEDGKFIAYEGEVRENSNFGYYIYPIVGGKVYTYSYKYSGNTSIRPLYFVDANGNFIGYDADVIGPAEAHDVAVQAPYDAAYIYLNYYHGYQSEFVLKEVGDYISSRDLKNRVEQVSPKLMKVVVKMLDRPVGNIFNNQDTTTVFYIRTKYNANKDIIITHYINGNELLSFLEAYVGPNALSDAQLMTSTYLVSSHSDSTAPFLHARTYWHIYAQHGCPMPRFNNTTSLTSDDEGSEWKDQLDRHFKIGLVTTNYVYLVPIMYQDANGHWVRDWRNVVDDASRPVTSLTHVSGATHTAAINTINDFTQVQVRPVMESVGRKWVADSREITEPGTYYCDEFKVSESAIGYDPATITKWFDNVGDNVDLTGASPLAEFTFSYNYKGAQCCVNTTLNIIREIEANSYGAIQQQFFLDKGDYKAMFLIPKAKAKNGVEIDKPFNSPSTSSTGYRIVRNTDDLKDVNDQVDRQIGYLYNPNTGDYLVGMAAGLSLVSGGTVKEKRNQNIPVGDTFRHLNLNFSPSNTNKFYVSAVSSVLFEDHDYYFQPGFFIEINYYVSYFDPAENTGQVYWYKDGSEYVIYCHCQSVQSRLAIKVPEFMEGLSLSVVEKTTNAELLTDTIQNGKFFVNYNTADANYIVLKAK